MRKFLPAFILATAGVMISCGVGGQVTGGKDVIPDESTYGGGGLRIVSMNVDKANTDIYPGQTLTISAKWETDFTPVKTKVKLCFEWADGYWFCGLNTPKVMFTCDGSGDPCQKGFTINCIYKNNETFPAFNNIECTVPDGTVDPAGDGFAKDDLPSDVCVYLVLESKDTEGKQYYTDSEEDAQCFTLHP